MLKFMRQHTFYKNLMLSYLIFILILSLVPISSFINTKHILTSQIETLSENSMSLFAQNANRNINHILHYESSVEAFLSNFPQIDLNNNDKTLPIRKFLSQITLTDYIKDIAIYSFAEDQILSTNIAVPKDVYFNMTFPSSLLSGTNKETWFEFINKTSYGKFMFFSNRSLQYMKSFTSKDNKNYNVIFIINPTIFFNYTYSNNNILVEDNGYVFSTSDKYSEIYKAYTENKKATSDNAIKSNGSYYSVSKLASEFNNYNYIQIRDYSVTNIALRHFYTRTAVEFLLFIVVGIYLSVFYSHKNYKPVKSLMSVLPSRIKDSSYAFTNLSTYIADIIKQNRELRLLSDKYFSNMKAMTVQRILYDYISPVVSLGMLLEKSCISFKYPEFYLLIFEIDNSEADSDISIKEIHFLIKNVMIDVFNTDFCHESISVGNIVASIINTDEKNHTILCEKLDYIKTFFKSFINVNINTCLSSPCNSLSKISTKYNEYMNASKTDSSSQANSNNVNNYYSYTQNDITHILKLLKNHSAQTAINYLNVFLVKNLYLNVPAAYTKCLLYDILVSVMTLSKDSHLNFIDDFMEIEDIENCLKCVESAFTYIAYENNSDEQNENKIANSIVSYIEENFSDINLSVSMIGQNLNKAPSYASKIFKSEFNTYLNDYIQFYRINKSIYLLNNTTESVKDIAIKLGFVNSNVFIRTFKKITGYSPNQYRKSAV